MIIRMKNQYKSTSPIIKIISNSLAKLPTPSNISYIWNIGSLLGLILITQIVSGILISFHYTANVRIAFESTVHIIREVNQGWLLRNTHINGASMFFVFAYIHITRGIMFSSFIKKSVWLRGIALILLIIATAFIGYVLPWGQISFWGATVITNLLSAIPKFGSIIVIWLWGGFSVDNATLNRFFSLHFILPFIIAAVSIVHLINLHEYLSSNPMGIQKKKDIIKFHPLFSWKDFNPIIFTIAIIFLISTLWPSAFGDPENFNMANPLVTPIHIQPEWYFLFAYAILRAIPNKLGGVIALVIRIIILSILSSKKKTISSSKFNPSIKIKTSALISSFLILTWLGANPAEPPFNNIRITVRIIYFSSFLLIYSLTEICLENKLKSNSRELTRSKFPYLYFVTTYLSVIQEWRAICTFLIANSSPQFNRKLLSNLIK